ncbi:hypothetical protein EQK42_02095 [Streptomyces albidoflavus]|nr:hypothetical protein EQK42_02095 [Streptomyces albidoflavus]
MGPLCGAHTTPGKAGQAPAGPSAARRDDTSWPGGAIRAGARAPRGSTTLTRPPRRRARPIGPTNLARAFTALLRRAGLRRIRFHDFRHSTETPPLERGVDLVVIKEPLDHAHIGVTATVYAHVRLRLQSQAIDTLGNALRSTDGDHDGPPAAVVR